MSKLFFLRVVILITTIFQAFDKSEAEQLFCYDCYMEYGENSSICDEPLKNSTQVSRCEGRFCAKLHGILEDQTIFIIRSCIQLVSSSCSEEILNEKRMFFEKTGNRTFKRACLNVCRYNYCNKSCRLADMGFSRFVAILLVPILLSIENAWDLPIVNMKYAKLVYKF